MIRFCKAVLTVAMLSFGSLALAVGDAQPVNINTADASTLARALKGVGESRAQAIVEYREAHGEFLDVYELANVKGIGERMVEMNEGNIVLAD
jgi:competence protein ComEA